MRPKRVAISGFSSNSGKTTLVCELLRRLPNWEAIKISRGHRRSCGKSAEFCCVSSLLSDQPLIVTDVAATSVEGKDTGRYWQAGASNVQWLICTDSQVREGVQSAVDRVTGDGVLIEGTSFLAHLPVDLSVMVAHSSSVEIKASALRVLDRASVLYISGSVPDDEWWQVVERKTRGRGIDLDRLPVYIESEVDRLAGKILELEGAQGS